MAPPWIGGAQQVLGGDLAVTIERGDIAGEPTDDPQPLAPMVRVRVNRQPGPHQRQLASDPF
jgi:hypothetical protein